MTDERRALLGDHAPILSAEEMKMLEEELQVSLFLRGTKKITLTDAGKTLYEQTGNLRMLLSFDKYFLIG